MASDDARFAQGRADRDLGTDQTIPLRDPADAASTELPDRMGVHIFIEAVLLLAFAGLLFALYRDDSAPLANRGMRDAIVVFTVPMLLCAVSVATSLRVGVPNLSVGLIALTSGYVFSLTTSHGVPTALAAGIGAALAVGVAVVVLIAIFRAPGWLATGGIGAVILLWLTNHADLSVVTQPAVSSLSPQRAWIWLASIAALSILAGTLGAMSGWRSRLLRCRRASAGGARREGVTINMIAFVVLGSAALAGLAGIWLVWTDTAQSSQFGTGLNVPMLTAFGFAAALLGGTSALGGRGGVLGTLLASMVLAAVLVWVAVAKWPIDALWIPLGTIGVGVVMTRIVEWLGRPVSPASRLDDDMPVDNGRYDASGDNHDSFYGPGDIDPYRGAGRQDGYGYK